MRPEAYDRARETIRSSGFNADTQTKIALFVGAAKAVNAAIFSAIELHPRVTAAYPFTHGQYFRELEFASLLARVTRWSPDPMIYLEGTRLAAALWQHWWRAQPAFDPSLVSGNGYATLALGHALLARVRLSPVIPDGTNGLDPFVAAIRRIEQENGRMIQAQIRLLKDSPGPPGASERERLIEAQQTAVDGTFEQFLKWLGRNGARSPSG